MLCAFFTFDESFSVSHNTLNFEKLWISKFPSRSFLIKNTCAFKRERERDDDDSDDDESILVLVLVAPLLFYVFVFKVVLIFEKK